MDKKISFRDILKNKEKKEKETKKKEPEGKKETEDKKEKGKITDKEKKITREKTSDKEGKKDRTPEIPTEEESERKLDSVSEMMIVREGKEYYGIPLEYVEEIKKNLKLTQTPQLPEFVSGVISLRDTMIPVVDFANLLGLRERKDRKSPIIIVEISKQLIGFQVDEVREIIEIMEEEILPLPEIFPSKIFSGAYDYNSGKVAGIMRLEGLLRGNQLKSLREVDYEDRE